MTWAIRQTDDIATCHALRRAVFIEEQGVSEADEVDGHDAEALHVLAHVDGVAMGCARILIGDGTAKIGRVCVLKDARGTGLGAAIIRACMDVARAQTGIRKAKLGAQVHALAFYERLGFAAYGPIYDDAGIAHRDMERDL
ncbi:GNAT family N-acetyltransferase [uncultured Tateyamaria sp.]|uniref:GNAT family N-acetyltransferase n=1 Tax=uncultured Tateyamaria sp. TaxID=455651 RepID=UPI00261D204D|nr:GNAT family N-acetyltransferase [uncultured Tateyamaria sp.]